MKKFYEANPDIKITKGEVIKEWQNTHKDIVIANNKKNGLKGAIKVSKKVTVLLEDGSTEVYNSISEFQRKTGHWMTTLKEKSAKGEFHNGYKLI